MPPFVKWYSENFIEPVALVQFICDKSTLLATSADDAV